MSEVGPSGDPLASLVARMWKLYSVEAGQPAYPLLARVAEGVIAEAGAEREWLKPLPRTTAHDLLSGKWKKVPDWWLVRTLVIVCHRIAVKSDLGIAPLDDLFREFNQLWRAAKENEGIPVPVVHSPVEPPLDADDHAAADGIAGDLLAPLAGEAPAQRPVQRTAPPVPLLPESRGRLGGRRLERAQEGDPWAAYELAVLLACEAAGMGESDSEEAKRCGDAAAYWRARAMGKVAQAAELRLHGLQLVKAARALAIEYKRAGRTGSMDFFRAVTKAEGAVQGLKFASAVGTRPREAAVFDDLNEPRGGDVLDGA
ncbi:hypothetical protein [Planomonospora sp. ID82291]|uniref:hypothetical protein n=1 Tax=Planomonospora sp. ID82291 TaxID=2738136 RepID=UPI0018C3AB34|nr:hypothetical protein [Planomonospora sp. ID82291]MBG0813383.1 hypothetical protein [Planomonospora sp. ID82291]